MPPALRVGGNVNWGRFMKSANQLTARERDFFNLVWRAGITNPFSDERAEIDLKIGGLFPEGSDTGDTEAAPAIWEDREGFDQALQEWADATAAALEAAPATLEDAKPVLGGVFGTCKNCHDTYRIDED